MQLVYDLQGISEKKFFCEMITYISEYIEDVEIAGNYRKVLIECNEKNVDEVNRKLELLKEMVIKQMTGKESALSVKTLEDYSERNTICHSDVFEQLLADGSIYALSDGAYAYGKIFLKIYQYFERKIEDYAINTFRDYEMQEQNVPVLYTVKGYEEGGYFETFPHHIMFEGVLRNDISVLNDFSTKGLDDGKVFENMKYPDNVLRTATCAPIYKFLRDSIIDSGHAKTFMVSGRCFRNEGNNTKTLERLKEFYMKEYVFVGSSEQIETCMSFAKEIWKYWIDVFQLNCKIETANDSFFANNYKKLKLFQLLGQSKQEFKLLIPSDAEYISCGSANYHRTHFTKRYHIYDGNNEKLANSGCFAFGVDRLTYAFLSQKGVDTQQWDESTIKEIRKYVNI